ncbi:MAG TPA: hypothetical protein IAD45_06620 [Candidatus Faecimonas intestinavium]|nr:hypothetical protein [Candidatus Faecimonas intestinavium]
MNKEVIENLEKNTYLKEKLRIINKLIEEKKYKEAYLKFATILEYINIKYIKAKYNIDMLDSSLINIVITYETRDKELYEKMKIINAEYNDVNLNDVEIKDIEYLASIIDSIYQYMLDNIGNFI